MRTMPSSHIDHNYGEGCWQEKFLALLSLGDKGPDAFFERSERTADQLFQIIRRGARIYFA